MGAGVVKRRAETALGNRFLQQWTKEAGKMKRPAADGLGSRSPSADGQRKVATKVNKISGAGMGFVVDFFQVFNADVGVNLSR